MKKSILIIKILALITGTIGYAGLLYNDWKIGLCVFLAIFSNNLANVKNDKPNM